MMIRLLLLAIVLGFGCAAVFGATDEKSSPWDRYQGTKKVGTHATLEACRAAVPMPGTQQCRVRITITKTVDAPPPPPAPTPATWIDCAREGARCAFTGRREVRYTAAAGAAVRQITKVAEGGVQCDDWPFAAATTNYENVCSYASTTTTAAVSVVLTPPATPPVVPPQPPVVTPPTSGDPPGPRVTSFTTVGPIAAAAGQVIAGVRIANPGGPCITIAAANVTVRDSELGPCGGEGSIVVTGPGALIEHVRVTSSTRGVFVRGSGAMLRKSVFTGPYANLCGDPRPGHCSHAIEFQDATGGTIDGNQVRGSNYKTDAVSFYQSSGMRLVNNDIDVQIDEPSGAAFTMGDSTTGNPGRDNYVAGNLVRQRGGVPAGVFGSAGNTVLERNCLTAGIQAYNYSGIFVGVTVRNNVINLGASFVPDTSVIAGWSTNINGTDCSKVPAP